MSTLELLARTARALDLARTPYEARVVQVAATILEQTIRKGSV
jgi:hypothetical protein